jgi:hypothetical protein
MKIKKTNAEQKQNAWITQCDYELEESWFPAMFEGTLDSWYCPFCGKQIMHITDKKGV